MDRAKLRYLLLPWAGLIGGAVGWGATDQIGSNMVQENCNLGSPLLLGLLGILGAALAVGGGWASYGLWRRSTADQTMPEAGNRRFIAAVAAMSAALFLIAIVAQTLAAFIIPACHR